MLFTSGLGTLVCGISVTFSWDTEVLLSQMTEITSVSDAFENSSVSEHGVWVPSAPLEWQQTSSSQD